MSELKFPAAMLLIGIAAFLGFRPLFLELESGIGAEVVAAAFGALFVIFSTAFLLRQQTREQEKLLEKSQNNKYQEEIFRVKFHKFQEVSEIISRINLTKIASIDDVKKLKSEIQTMEIYTAGETVDALTKLVVELQNIDEYREEDDLVSHENDIGIIHIPESRIQIIDKSASEFYRHCRAELGLSPISLGKDDITAINSRQDANISAISENLSQMEIRHSSKWTDISKDQWIQEYTEMGPSRELVDLCTNVAERITKMNGVRAIFRPGDFSIQRETAIDGKKVLLRIGRRKKFLLYSFPNIRDIESVNVIAKIIPDKEKLVRDRSISGRILPEHANDEFAAALERAIRVADSVQ